jgi:predicted short-subunit dehydrogenase-like oxidoreductase (DUF2520 family)
VPTRDGPPLAGLRFSLVGAGKVGTSLAAWAVAGGGEMVARVGRDGLAELTSGGQDLLLIAVPDGALPEVAARLAVRPQAAVALHTAGSRGASVLAPLGAAGAAPGALHPLKAFPRPLPDPVEARGVFFALDGEPAALRLASRLVDAWQGERALVPAAARPVYHLAATLAAGGVATLLGIAAELARTAGLPEAVARGYLELARGTLAAAAAPAPPPITGPLARGDRATFELLLDNLRRTAPERVPLVLALARETLRLAAGGAESAGGADGAHGALDELRAWVEAEAPTPPAARRRAR